MDGVSSIVTVVELFKEVYLLARFVYKSAKSASHWQDEEKDLLADFDFQLMHFKSFWAMFTKFDGKFVDDEQLTQEWLDKIQRIVEKMHAIFVQFTKTAVQHDEEYRLYSPYRDVDSTRPLLELPPELKTVERSALNLSRKTFLSGVFWKLGKSPAGQSATNVVDGLSWALIKRGKLRNILDEFTKENNKLLGLTSYILGTWRVLNEPGLFTKVKEDARYALFLPHVQLMEIARHPETAPSDASSLVTTQKAAEVRPRQLVEQKFFDQKNSPETNQAVAQLAMLLSTAGQHNFRTLPLQGYLKEDSAQCYRFYFGYPAKAADLPPQNLHGIIAARTKISLATRFQIAQTIALSVGAFHSSGWVHKSIRSHAIKFFFTEDDHKTPDLHSPYLTDFEFSRPGGAATHLTEGDPDLEKSVYRHPDRDGPPTVNFNKAHDIFSLGIVLLEIGLWNDAVSMYQTARTDLEKHAMDGAKGLSPTSSSVKRLMKARASKLLPHTMGQAYCDAVLVCLSEEFHHKLEQNDFAITYAERVVEMLDVKRLSE